MTVSQQTYRSLFVLFVHVIYITHPMPRMGHKGHLAARAMPWLISLQILAWYQKAVYPFR